jgi:probable phosphoglycerate mutase
MNEPTLLLLIRHGETAWNADARIQGHTDIELNARGHAQAQALAGALADAELDAIYCSDLTRARQTAAPQACASWRARDPAFAAPGGERLDMFYARVTDAVLRIAAGHPGRSVALVSHGGALDCLYRHASGQSLAAPRSWELRNAAINRVLVADGRMTLVGWNDAAHLDTVLDETSA